MSALEQSQLLGAVAGYRCSLLLLLAVFAAVVVVWALQRRKWDKRQEHYFSLLRDVAVFLAAHAGFSKESVAQARSQVETKDDLVSVVAVDDKDGSGVRRVAFPGLGDEQAADDFQEYVSPSGGLPDAPVEAMDVVTSDSNGHTERDSKESSFSRAFGGAPVSEVAINGGDASSSAAAVVSASSLESHAFGDESMPGVAVNDLRRVSSVDAGVSEVPVWSSGSEAPSSYSLEFASDRFLL